MQPLGDERGEVQTRGGEINGLGAHDQVDPLFGDNFLHDGTQCEVQFLLDRIFARLGDLLQIFACMPEVFYFKCDQCGVGRELIFGPIGSLFVAARGQARKSSLTV